MKQITTLVYVFIDDRNYVGRGANIVLSDKKRITFRAPIGVFNERVLRELDDFTFDTPLTQEELDRISLPQSYMLKSKLYITEAKLYVEYDVVVRQSLTGGSNG